MARLAVTAEEVAAMAAYLGINLDKDEFWLIPIARASAEAPVPNPWEEMEDENGNPYFVNPKSGKSSRRHPMDKQYLELVHSARKRGMPAGNMKQTWMAFAGENGEMTYFDFSVGSHSSTAPPEDEMIPEMPDAKRPQWDPRFEATTLEKRAEKIKELKCLTFHAWWDEDQEDTDLTFRVDSNTNVGGGLKRRYMSIKFDIDSNSFEVTMDEAQLDGTGRKVTLPYVPNVTAAFGMPVQIWDLYIGAQLKVLGRLVTLSAASLETVQWLDSKAKALEKLKADLLTTIAKYDTKAKPTAQVFTRGTHRKDRHERSQLVPAGMSLRVCVDAVRGLIEDLSRHRPSVAAKKAKVLETITGLTV